MSMQRNLSAIVITGVLCFQSLFAVAQDTADETAQRLQHKIKMVNLILTSPSLRQRLQSSDDEVAHNLHSRAVTNLEDVHGYFDDGRYLEAEAILDFVLRDLSAASQLLSADSRKQGSYDQVLRQLDSFELPQWQGLTDEQSDYLQQQMLMIGELRAQAIDAAQQREFDQAINKLDRAYVLKSRLLDDLPHPNLLVYDLIFDSPLDEYEYLNQRANHYYELVELALSRAVIGIQERNLVDDYLYQSLADLEAAENFAARERTAEANDKLQESIKRMISILKILGINI